MLEKNYLTFEDVVKSVVVKMSQGNPGAVTVLMQLLDESPEGLKHIQHMDDREIRGYKIWVLYKNICGFNLNSLKEFVADRNNGLEALIDKVDKGVE